MPCRRDDAKLLHQVQHVPFSPLFHNLAVYNPVDVGAGNGRFLPRWWDPLKRTCVLEPNGIVDSHHVALRDQELGCEMDVVEGGEVGGNQVFECLATSDGTRCTSHMTYIVGGVEFID